MSLGQDLAPHLPFLRRYARALTGSQVHGDNFVRATLEAIVAAARRIPARRRSAARPLPHLPRDLVDRQYRRGRGADDGDRRRRGHRPGAPRPDHAAVAPGAAADRDGRLLDRGCGLSDRRHARRRRIAGRRGAGRDRAPDPRRRADHRGRADHRDGHRDRSSATSATTSPASRSPATKRSPRRASRRRAWCSPTSSSPTTAAGSTRSRTSSPNSRCR